MAKTYTAVTVANATAGNAILASDHSTNFQNVNNLIVPPSCRVTLSSSINPYTQGSAISWSSASIDTDSMFSSGSATRITINTTGIYAVTFVGQTTAGSSPTVFAPQIVVSGTNVAQSYLRPLSNGTGIFSIGAILSLTATQYLEFNVEWEGGASFVVAGGSGVSRSITRAEAVWIGRTS